MKQYFINWGKTFLELWLIVAALFTIYLLISVLMYYNDCAAMVAEFGLKAFLWGVFVISIRIITVSALIGSFIVSFLPRRI